MSFVLFFFIGWQFVRSLASLRMSSFFIRGHKSAGVLHFKNGILAEVDKSLQLFLISLGYNRVEEGAF